MVAPRMGYPPIERRNLPAPRVLPSQVSLFKLLIGAICVAGVRFAAAPSILGQFQNREKQANNFAGNLLITHG